MERFQEKFENDDSIYRVLTRKVCDTYESFEKGHRRINTVEPKLSSSKRSPLFDSFSDPKKKIRMLRRLE